MAPLYSTVYLGELQFESSLVMIHVHGGLALIMQFCLVMALQLCNIYINGMYIYEKAGFYCTSLKSIYIGNLHAKVSQVGSLYDN